MRFITFTFLLTLSMAVNLAAQDTISLKHGAHRIGPRTDVQMQEWRDNSFGQFIHWGVYSIPAGKWNDKTYKGASEWIRVWKEMPRASYDSLYLGFNPDQFNARKWASMAKDMGARYMILTTKHHDGFCMWPSKYTDYSIANTPYQKDIVGEFVKAYNEVGIDVVLYFSIIDWNHPGFRNSIKSTSDSIAYQEFKTFTRNQLLELVNTYPTLKGFWFDGTWDPAWKQQAEFADELQKELCSIHPGLVIGSRFRPDDYGKRGSDSNGRLIGDYEQGWERELPDNFEQLQGRDWECVMTIPENQWGYHSEWFGYIKKPYDIIEMLVKTISMNGNFVLNFGPDAKGLIREEEKQMSDEVGKWLKENGRAIYGCDHVNYKKQDWGYYTTDKENVYMTVVNRPLDNQLSVEIPKGTALPEKCTFLNNGKKLKLIDGGKTKKGDLQFFVVLPESFRSKHPFVLVLN